jgi:hypothetical protein
MFKLKDNSSARPIFDPFEGFGIVASVKYEEVQDHESPDVTPTDKSAGFCPNT